LSGTKTVELAGAGCGGAGRDGGAAGCEDATLVLEGFPKSRASRLFNNPTRIWAASHLVTAVRGPNEPSGFSFMKPLATIALTPFVEAGAI
jgi:hypothetical protein